jgi:hypothetical protein
LKDPGVDGVIIKLYVKEKEQALECNDMIHSKDKWWAVVNAVMNLRVPHITVSFLTR